MEAHKSRDRLVMNPEETNRFFNIRFKKSIFSRLNRKDAVENVAQFLLKRQSKSFVQGGSEVHHTLDITPIPERVLYVNDPNITRQFFNSINDPVSETQDIIRIYAPIDISENILMQSMHHIIDFFKNFATESNEFDFQNAVERIVERLELYDQVWFTRETVISGKQNETGNEKSVSLHSNHATATAQEIVNLLAGIDSTAELFPYEMIDQLCAEYAVVPPDDYCI